VSDDKRKAPRARPRPGRAGRRRSTGPTESRLIATRVLERVQRTQAFADLALHHALARSGLAAPERALATELVYGTLRWRGRLDFLLSQVLDRRLDDLEPLVANTLRLGAYQIVFTDRIPSTAAVDQAVHCTRALGAERATGLVNACLRRLAREVEEIALPELEADPLGHLTHTLSLPPWIAERWLADYGPEEAAAFARASNAAPPLTVRANRLRTSRDTLLGEVKARFSEAVACRFAVDGVQLGRRGAAGHDPAFLAGDFTPQDEAAQLVVELLDPATGEHALDCCAAPGGKSTAIAERVGETGWVLALDRHPARLRLVTRAASRLGLGWVQIHPCDASKPLDDLPSRPGGDHDAAQDGFDRVLVDAPCSGLGTLRRNPDARWRVRPEDIPSLAELQRDLLSQAAKRVKPGGCLVYSTCTVLREENEDQIDAFLAAQPGFRLVPKAELPEHLAPLLGDEGIMRCWPHRHDADGFFAARLERTS
jgi:16S rRNA (cytosine967-C5)-methyltransferase